MESPKSTTRHGALADAFKGDLAVIAVILLVYFVVAAFYISGPGLAWDEAVYVPFAETYRLWLANLPDTFNWQDFHNSLGLYQSHPPLSKYAIAATTQLFGNSMGRLLAARAAGVFTMAALLAAVYFFVLKTRTRLEAALSCIFLVVMPRFFAHGLFALQDMPMALWWFVAAALFYAAAEKPRLAWVAGLAAGLALLTKINGLALPLVLWPWGLYFYGRKSLPVVLWSAVLAPLVFFFLWPFIWFAPLINVGKYLGEKFNFVVSLYRWFGVDLLREGDAAHRMMRRTAVPVFYLGRVYREAVPWHYAAVMTCVTTPLGILAAAAGGAVRWTKTRRESKYYAFVIWNILFWIIAFSTPLARPYDGVRLYLNIFPFVAMLAAAGGAWAWEAVRARLGARAGGVLLVIFVASQATGFVMLEPWGLSYYNLAAGGTERATGRFFPVTYWGETADYDIAGYINAHAAEGAKVASYPMGRLYVENMRYFGLLRADLRDVTHEADWDWLIVANRGEFLIERPDIAEMTATAVATKRVSGVEAAWVVERKR